MAESKLELKSLLMKVKEQSEKLAENSTLNKETNKTTKILASGHITSWQIDGEKVETVTHFVFLGSEINADSDCSNGIKHHLFLGRKAMTNLDSVLKRENFVTLLTGVSIVKAMLSPVVMYASENWTIKKAECQRTDAF